MDNYAEQARAFRLRVLHFLADKGPDGKSPQLHEFPSSLRTNTIYGLNEVLQALYGEGLVTRYGKERYEYRLSENGQKYVLENPLPAYALAPRRRGSAQSNRLERCLTEFFETMPGCDGRAEELAKKLLQKLQAEKLINGNGQVRR